MAKSETFRDADRLSIPVASGTKAGTPLNINGLNMVTETDRANTVGVNPVNNDGSINPDYNWGGGNPDGNASVSLRGAYVFTVSFAVAAVLTPIYITSGGALTATASGNTLYGHALTTKSGSAGPLTVRIAN